MQYVDRMHGYFREDVEKRSRETTTELQETRFLEILRYTYENCPGMREKLQNRPQRIDDIRGLNDLRKLPVLAKGELIELQRNAPPFGGLLGVPEEKLSWIFISPGPIYDPAAASNEDRESTLTTALFSCGFRKGDKVLNTWSYHMVPAGMYCDLALRNLGCIVIPSGTGNTESQVQILKNLKVTGFVGTTGYLINIIEKAEQMGIDPKKNFNLEVALVGGEPGGGPIRRVLEEKYGIITGDFYGTADVGVIAYECREKRGMHLTDNAIVEILDADSREVLPPGEVGEIVVTTFNKTYPLIRFGTGDLSVLNLEYCPCGRTSPMIPKILGRVGEAVRVRGMLIYAKQCEQVIKLFPEILAFNITVTRPKYRDLLKLEAELKGHSIQREILITALAQKFQEICRITPDEIVLLHSGELRDRKGIITDERTY